MAIGIVGQGRTTTAAGTKVLGTSLECREVILQSDDGTDAANANTLPVFVGNADVTVAAGIVLRPGASLTIETDDIADIYLACSAATQKISWIARR